MLRFQRWLRTKNGDAVAIQASRDGVNWITIWSTTGTMTDSAWVSVQHPLPASFADSASLRLRWSLAANASQNELGWNIDDVELLGAATAAAATASAASPGAAKSSKVLLANQPVSISLLRAPVTGLPQILLAGQPWSTYVIEASSDLARWDMVETSTTAQDGNLVHHDTDFERHPRRFYRARPLE